MRSLNIFHLLLLFFLVFNVGCAGTTTAAKYKTSGFDWNPLIDKLAADGLDKDYLLRLYSSPNVSFNPRVMPKKITHQEKKLNYAQFLEERRISRGKEFIKNNEALMIEVEGAYGVPKEIQAAILLVETGFGDFLGSDLAINILSSMAMSSSMEHVKPYLPHDYAIDSTVTEKIEKKSRWAYNELKSFIQYARQNNIDPVGIKGSIFGAIGMCQFMPSNILKFGIDHNKDNKIDLFLIDDALASMSNYLVHYGWKPGISSEQQEKVIMKYNPSQPYTETILAVAHKLGWKGYIPDSGAMSSQDLSIFEKQR
jgi:membrane-bound lytic murein transglycosylase B